MPETKNIIVLSSEQLKKIYTDTSEKVIEYMITNENTGAANLKIIDKFNEFAKQQIISNITEFDKNFNEKSEEEKLQNIEYNINELKKIQQDDD